MSNTSRISAAIAFLVAATVAGVTIGVSDVVLKSTADWLETIAFILVPSAVIAALVYLLTHVSTNSNGKVKRHENS